MKKLFGCLMFIGAILLYGTAGASDHELIDWAQTVLQASIASCMIIGGLIGIKVIDKINKKNETPPADQFRKRS